MQYIVENIKGEFLIDSEVGEGTSVVVTIPVKLTTKHSRKSQIAYQDHLAQYHQELFQGFVKMKGTDPGLQSQPQDKQSLTFRNN